MFLLLQNLYPELGVELEERAYGESCALILSDGSINWETIKATVFDEFVVAHTLGWWGKALILRDYKMLWVVSVTFELMELTFQHMLPNFNECWWDSWILDVAICNFIGILTGMWTVKYFDSKEYNWSGLSQQPTLFAKARRGIMQFTPYSLDAFRWQVFSSPKRCLQCLFPVVIILLFEVNHFFLKFELWVPPRNPLNTIRLSILFLMAVPGMKVRGMVVLYSNALSMFGWMDCGRPRMCSLTHVQEYYEFIESESTDIFRKLGPFAWTAAAIAFVETLTVIKFGHGLFPQPWPTRVFVAWSSVAIIFAVTLLTWSYRYYILGIRGKHATLQSGKKKH